MRRCRSCAARRTSPSASACPVALPGANLPGGRHIGVTSIQGVGEPGHALLGRRARTDRRLGRHPDPRPGSRRSRRCPASRLAGRWPRSPATRCSTSTSSPTAATHCRSIGLAREVAAITGSKVRWPEITVPESGDSTNDHVWVEVADRRLCTRFVGRYVDQLKIGPSPLSVQLRLGGGGHAPDLERRRREQLRDARAGQADPRLRRRGRDRRRDRRPAGQGRRADHHARSR